MEPRLAVLKPLSSAISIGSGGPFGAEGPIIMTGGAFGSMIGQLFRLSGQERKTLLVAGAAAGMAATFDSPIAATLLAVELLLFEWRPRSMIPVAMGAVTAAVVRHFLLGSGPLFAIPVHPAFAGVGPLVACLGVGVAAGALSAILTQGVYLWEDLFGRLPIHWMWWPAIGGLAIGLGGLIFPHALGVGYDTLGQLLNGKVAGGRTPATNGRPAGGLRLGGRGAKPQQPAAPASEPRSLAPKPGAKPTNPKKGGPAKRQPR